MNSSKIADNSRVRKSVFGFFWGIAHFVDEFRQPNVLMPDSFEGALHISVYVLAVILLFRPSSDLRLGLLAAANVVLIVVEMPIMPNHNLIFFMADSAILATMLWYSFIKKQALWFPGAEPFLRLALFITYGSATIAKLNSGWFNADLSCACSMPAQEFAFLPFDITWTALVFMPYVVFLAELSVWLLPLFKRTRFVGLVIASLFHVSISLTPDSQGLGFSFLLFGLLILYLPDSAMRSIHRFGLARLKSIKDRGLLALIVFGFLGLASFFGYAAFLSLDRELLSVLRYGPVLALLIVWASSIIFLAIKHRKEQQVERAIGVSNPLQVFLAVLIVANSISPYFGLKTYATMTMYSNLQMEIGKSNHLLIPRIEIESLADDLVDVVATANPKVGSWAARDYQVTWHELRREMSKTPELPIAYIRDGVLYEYSYAAENIELVTTDPILHKITGFRPSGRQPYCLW